MSASKKYSRIYFENYPSENTPLNATNLNKLDKGIDDLDDDIVSIKDQLENFEPDASHISYNKTGTIFTSTNVQGALNEVSTDLTCGAYTGSSTLAASIDSYVAQANMKNNETRRVKITVGSAKYIVEITKTDSNIYTGIALKNNDANARYTISKNGGASTVISPFKRNRVLVGSWSRSWNNSDQDHASYVQYFNCTSVPNYRYLTADDFSVEFTSVTIGGWQSADSYSFTPTKTYNATSGQLGVSGLLSVSEDDRWCGISASTGNIYAYI